MQVEQAIFTSVRSRKSQGYHLVAQSPGLTDEMAHSLTKWGPSHASLLVDTPNAESLNFHPVDEHWCAVSRTTYGGPEYSGRGGLQVFTQYLVMRKDQLGRYGNNPLAVARTARTLGHLRLRMTVPGELEALELPDHPLPPPIGASERDMRQLPEVMRILRFQNRVAVLGLDNPIPMLAKVLRDTPMDDRLDISFCTGLKPSVHRKFRLLFIGLADAHVHSQLTSEGIDFVVAG